MTTPQPSAGYEHTANTLRDRILALISGHPEILEMREPSELYQIVEFNCNDLGPSLSQAQWALGRAKQEWKSNQVAERERTEP